MNENVNVNFTDGGSLNKLNAGAEKIKTNLEHAAAASGRIANPVAAAQQGLANKRSMGQAAQDSNTARGVGEMTGAAGRDFAAQAKGLGGLVHVYATFAANIFAISAAFTALNKAANIDNMIKGLDQLGAASGRNLEQVAKGLMEVTDGALSLADSMTAVAQASAGGMSSQNILRMGEVAKKASQALGRDMSDAINRLSRGITKIEPELLDELGIMIKVDEASRNYARTLGKTAASLSDFEKRQGYANAVLEEGERKFGSINLDANPYQKIQASVNNLAQATGSLINDFLGPLLNLLSSSPTALATTLGLIATTLLRQAVPAISLWREKMEGAAKAARDAAIEANKLRVSRRDEATEAMTVDFGKREAAAAAKTKALADQLMANTRVAKSTAELLKSATSGEMDADKIAALEKQAAVRGKLSLLEEGASKRRQTNAAERQKEAEGIRQVTAAAKEQLAVEMARAKFVGDNPPSKMEKAKSGLFGYLSNDQAQTRIADRAVAKSQQAAILSDLAKNVPEKGMIQAWKDLNMQIANARNKIKENGEEWDKNEKAMGAWNAGATRVKGALALVTSGVTTLIRSLSTLFFYVGIVVTVYQTLNAIFSTGKKETEAYSSALESVEASTENVARTLESIEKGGFEKAFSTESIQARANAFGELTDSIETSLRAFNKMREAQSWWEKGWDWVADKLPFIDGAAEKLVKSFAGSISSSFKLLQGGPLQGQASKIISDTFGISGIDLSKPKEFEAAIGKLNLTQEQFIEKARNAQMALSALSKEFNNSASYTTAFAGNITEIAKLVDDMNNALLPKDNTGKAGQLLITSSRNMAEALKEPANAMASLIKLSGDMKTLSLLPPDTANQLIRAKEELTLITTRLAEAKANLAKVGDLPKARPLREIPRGVDAQERKELEAINLRIKAENDKRIRDKQALQDQVNIWERAQASAIKEFGKGMDSVLFTKGVANLTASLNLALAQGGITAAKGYLSVLKQAGGATAAEEGKLEQANFKAQLALIDANYYSAKQTELLAIAIEKDRLERSRAAITAKGITSSPELDEIDRSLRQLANREKFVTLDTKGFKALVDASLDSKSNMSTEMREAVRQSGALFAQMIGREQQRAGILGQAEASKANSKANETVQNAQLEKDRLVTSKQVLDTKIAENAQTIALVGRYTEINQLEKQDLELKALKNTQAQVENELAVKAKLSEQAMSYYAKDSINYINAKIAAKDTETKQDALAKKSAQEISALNNKHLSERLAGNESIRALTADIAAKELKDATDLANIQIGNSENVLNFRQRMGFIQAEELADKQATIALAKQENALAVERNTLDNTWAAQKASMEAKIASAKSLNKPTKYLDKDLKTAEDSYKRQVNLLEERDKSIKTGIELQKESSTELAKQEEFTKNLVSMTESLALVFGEVGAAIGAVAQVMDKMGKKQLQYEGERIALEKERIELVSDNDDYEGQLKNADKLAANAKRMTKLEEDQAISQLNNIGAIAAATKQMFAEKTAAYKVFDAVQKASAIMSMTLQAQQMAKQLAALPGLISGGVGKLVSQGGFAGLAAAAGFIALMASLGGDSGSSVPTAGLSAADMQQTQGTGSSWNNGKVEENGGGVFGDSEAKSESIVNSLEIIKDNTIAGLKYDNKMLKALENIDAGINSTAKALYKIPGLRSGSITGTADSSTSSSGIQGFFGKTTTEEIIDSGIILSGTFTQLADSATGLVSAYETIRKTTVKSGFLGIGGGTKTSEDRNVTGVPPEVEREISAIFASAEELFIALGDRVGLTAETVTNKLNNIDLGKAFISLRGLKGEELVNEFNAVISSIMDGAAATVFESMQQYADFGEGLLETTIRVIDANDKIKIAVESVGMTISNFSFEVTEALVQAAGGLDEFTDQINFFAENFLTESQRLAPVMENVTSTLADMSLSWVDTREEFARVVNSLDLTTESGRTTFSSLMDLAEAFTMVYPAIEEATDSFDDLVKEGKELQDTLNKLTMTEAEYTATITAGYTERELAQYNSNQLLKDEIALIEQKNSLTQKNKDLEVELLRAAGLTGLATKLQRSRELAAIEPANRALQISIWRREDEIKRLNEKNTITERYNNAEIALLRAQGRETEATNLQRSRELAAILPANRALQVSTWAREDEAAAINTSNQALGSLKSQMASFQNAAASSGQAVMAASQAITAGYTAALANVQAAQNNITAGYTAAKARTAAAAQAIIAAQTNITNNLVAARQAVASAAESVAAAQDQAADELRGLAKNIRDFINSISTSALSINSPKEQLAILQNQFKDEATAAKSGDKNALASITGTSQKLLELSKTQAATKLEYARTVGTVTSVLDAIAAQTEAAAGPDRAEQDPVAKAQADLLAATYEMQRWQQAAAESGASTVALQEDLLAEYKKAKEEESAAMLDEETWRTAVQESGANAEMAVTDYLAEWRSAQDELVAWERAMQESGANTETEIRDYARDWRIAAAEDAVARNNLEEAMRLSAGIDLRQATALEEFKTTLNTYLKAQALIGSSSTEKTTLGDVDSSLDSLETVTESSALTIATSISEMASDIIEALRVRFTDLTTALNSGFMVLKTNINTAINTATNDAKRNINTNTERYTGITNTKVAQVMSGITGISVKIDTLLARPAANDSKRSLDEGAILLDQFFPGVYANGGMHEGGLRIVGEKGPELEATGPSRIYSNKQTKDLLGNQELIKEIQELRKEVASLRFASQQTELHTRKTKDLLVRVSKDGQALYTEAA